MIEDKLRSIGLKEKEVAVYLCALEHRKVSASMISRLTGLKRSTAYTIAEELVGGGLLERDSNTHTTFYLVNSAQSLVSYINRKKRKAIQDEKIVNEILPELELIPKPYKPSVPRVQYIEGEKEIEEFLYKQTDEWTRSTMACADRTHWAISDQSFIEIPRFKKWIEWSWREKFPKEINLKLFVNQSEELIPLEESLKIPRRKTKLWDAEPLTAGYWVMGDYMLSVNTKEEPYFVIQIHDRLQAENLRKIYSELWRLKD